MEDAAQVSLLAASRTAFFEIATSAATLLVAALVLSCSPDRSLSACRQDDGRIGVGVGQVAVKPEPASRAVLADTFQIALLVCRAVLAGALFVVEVERDPAELHDALPHPAVVEPQPQFGVLVAPSLERFVVAVYPDGVFAPQGHVAAAR